MGNLWTICFLIVSMRTIFGPWYFVCLEFSRLWICWLVGVGLLGERGTVKMGSAPKNFTTVSGLEPLTLYFSHLLS